MRTVFCLLTGMLGLILLGAMAAGHGQPPAEPAPPREPQGPYSKSGPIGQFFRALRGDPRLKKVGIAGLGNGSLASYSEAGQEWTFFDADEDANKTAEDPRRFTFLRDAKAKVRFELGDPRLRLTKSKETFGLLVIDTFDPHAIPIHLLTREAVVAYREHLLADGILVFHISNRHVDLEPVLATLAADAKWVAYSLRHAPSEKEKKLGVTESRWVVMARQKEHLKPLLKTGSWQPVRAKAGSKIWTDDYSNLLEFLLQKKGDK
jgi:spermidine synthase